ncbi:MAG TPA: chemotaxis protein CheW [Polyangia bacterium]|nr:chemotaxis protein CheW [Polyangia bacterium]
MTQAAGPLAAAAATAARMRAEFDRGFALPPPVAGDTHEEFLAIRVAGDPCALRLADLLGVYVDRKVVPLPSSVPTLLGIASFRGALVPVHDLRLLLGYPARADARWLVRVRAAAPIGLAFDALEGQFRATAEGGLVRALDALRPVIDLGGALARLGSSAAAARAQEED